MKSGPLICVTGSTTKFQTLKIIDKYSLKMTNSQSNCGIYLLKNSQIVTNELSNNLTTSKQSGKIESDRRAELYTSTFQNFLKGKNIQHYS